MQYQKPRKRRRFGFPLLVLLVLAGYTAWSLTRATPLLTSPDMQQSLRLTTPTAAFPWPSYGQAAVGVVGNSNQAANGVQRPLPTASVAKVITVLSVLHKKPLQLGQTGPDLVIGSQDIDLYNSYAAQGGSLVPVNSGEHINQYQAMEAVLLPSANNMADSLAIWAFGSLPAYSAYANSYVKQLGLANTHIGSDASGFNSNTTSTADDLVKLGKAAMANPVISQIVGQSVANDIPVAGTVYNVNSLLGTSGIVGIKTGNTEQAGGVFLGAARTTVNNKAVTVVTAIMGAPTLGSALRDSLPLVAAAQANFAHVDVLAKGAIIGHYQQPWGGSIAIVADSGLSVTAWRGSSVVATPTVASTIEPTAVAGQKVGTMLISAGQADAAQRTDLRLASAPTKPSLVWKWLHPLR